MRSLLGRFHRPMSRGLVNNMLMMNNLGDGSTLSLDFTTTGGVLDPRLTFSRASAATFVNSSGYVEWAGANLVLNSTMLVGTSFTTVTSGGGTVTINNDNTVTFASTAGRATWLQSIASLQVGLSVTFSIEVTALTNTNIRVSDLFQAGTGFSSQVYNYTDSSGNTTAGIGAFTTLPGIGLYTINAVITATPGNVIFGTDCNGVARTGSVTITRPQFQYGTRVSSRVYFANSSTAAAYQAPRFDYSPTNIGEPMGLLIEGSSINYVTNSSLFSGYNNSGMSAVTAGSEPNPEGTANSARQIYATVGGTYHSLYLSTTAGTNTQITVSIWAKARNYTHLFFGDLVSGRSAVRFNLSTGATDNNLGVGFVSAKTTAFPNGWWRCEMVVNVTASTSYGWSFVGVPSGATLGVYGAQYAGTGNAADGIYCYGFSVEAGSGASSYIPTGASQVTRAVDTAIIAAGTNFSSWYTGGTTGTFVSNWYGSASSTTARSVIATSDVDDQHLHMYQTASALTLRLADFGALATVTTANNLTANALTKGAFSYAGTATSLCLNGGTVATNTLGFSVAPTFLSIGGPSTTGTTITDTSVMLNNSIRTLKYYPTRLTDAQIKDITT